MPALKRFTRRGTFICQCCNRRTREVNGDHAQTGNCALCFDLAGIENTISDNGIDAVSDYYEEARDLLTRLEKIGGNLSNWADLVSVLDEWRSRNGN